MPRIHNVDNYYHGFYHLVVAAMEIQGKDPSRCWSCGKKAPQHIHHKKYDGATIADLEFSCVSCNMLAKNKNLD